MELMTIFYDFYKYHTKCSSLIASVLGAMKDNHSSKPVVHNILKIWGQFREHFGSQSFSTLLPLIMNPCLSSSLLDSEIYSWHSRGLRSVRGLFVNLCFRSSDEPSAEFNIPKSHFYRYLQLKHFVQNLIPFFPAFPPAAPFPFICELDPYTIVSISVIYEHLNRIHLSFLTVIRAAWENNLQFTRSDQDWSSTLSRADSTDFRMTSTSLRGRVHRTKPPERKHESIEGLKTRVKSTAMHFVMQRRTLQCEA
ncbi:hypothetical protein Z043_104028 [Scleropages formosus]|uniref:Uncharacterized protein n=1 Tax=Scleropages formosus TaxID=113540 RepID=A0A0P7VL44_SCLFO|nr:hypothetical protein Z043_104028 [Scleropages formosus]